MKVAVVIPTFNEKKNLEKLLPNVQWIFPEGNIFVIDDGSKDGTVEYARSQGAIVPYTFMRRGLCKSYLEGLAMAAYESDCDVAIHMDGDHPVGYVPKFVGKLLKENLEMVVGYETDTRTTTSKGASWIAKKIIGKELHQPTCGFVAFRTDLLRKIPLRKFNSVRDFYHIEILYMAKKCGAKIGELEFTGHSHGNSSLTRIGVWLMDMAIFEIRRWLHVI